MKSIFAITILNLTLLCALAQNFESNSIFSLRPSEERYLQQSKSPFSATRTVHVFKNFFPSLLNVNISFV